MNIVGIIVFVVTYVLVSARRLAALGLDRPAAALLGAVACVALGVLSPAQALGAVDGATVLLLFGVMGMGAFLAVDGFFVQLERALVVRARTPTRLLGAIVWGAGGLSALITNDAVCVLAAPLVVRLVQRHRLPPLPYLLALATAANTGSVATLVGNPQNMLCGLLGGLSYMDYTLLMAPVAVVGLAINHVVLAVAFRHPLAAARLAAQPSVAHDGLTARTLVNLGVIAGTAVVYATGAHLAWAAAGGFVLLMLLHRRDTRQLWARIDWSLLLFFAGLFIVVEGFVQSGATSWLFEHATLADVVAGPAGHVGLAGLFLVGSNVVSNVPFILVIRDQMATLADPTLGWQLLAMASTFAGNLTLLGSVANIIVAESGREVGGMGFWQYARVGLPIAVATSAFGTLWVLMVRGAW